MNNEEYVIMTRKVIKHAPEWLKTDIINIVNKEGDKVRVSHAISLLYNQYSFNLGHIFASMDQNYDWAATAHNHLNYIDNNIDLVELMLKEAKKNVN
ncbi:hypothetical protein [Oceanobacillus chungangensis]|uniref:Uncharacterized protein n=1 Tax=Oceanobacillus chungangensis TaxID=1229152 RepID=A0A3D8PIT6_9BACI|nr:hypothetical protein [Oceanobacillus chungangensis]RDW15397.1 hypothetical protein CWR45_16550 [Oceanobacillus chungangensis]